VYCASRVNGPKQVIVGIHPHGVAADFRVLFDGLIPESITCINSWRFIAASVVFRVPVLREIALWTHCIDASKDTVERNIQSGHSIMMTPGGEVEQLLTQYGKEKVYIKNRQGFVRLAVKYGLPIVPCYVFGCSDLFYTSSFMLSFRMWLTKKFRIAIPLAWGRYGCVPGKGSLKMVFGNPIAVEAMTYDDRKYDTYVNEIHSKYVSELQRVFCAYKTKFGYGDRALEIY